MTISPTERMLVEQDGPIAWVTFNNPARRNAVSMDMWEAVPVILDHLERDTSVRVIALKGAGDKAFVSGADISQFESQRSSAEGMARYDALAEGALRRIAETSKPTIAMIHGYCFGGGVGIALGCDIRIADETARFAIPAAKLGVSYRWNGIKRLLEVVGPAYAKEIFFTARHFTAAEALEMGLLNRVVAEADLAAYVRSYGEMIGQNAPLTLAAAKGVIAELTKPAADLDRAKCEALVKKCFASQDYIEGRRAFMEKRKPAFQGK